MESIVNKTALRLRDTVEDAQGNKYMIQEFIGRGGQGEVYRVVGKDGTYALKWYHAEECLKKIRVEPFYKNLKTNIDSGIPKLSMGNKATQFIWPLKLIPHQKGSFGYLMKLFEPGYESLTDVVLGRKKDKKTGALIPLRWKSWFTMITAALNIVGAFEILHSVGLSYQDLNEGGIAINMETGDVMICDCDNVSPDGVNLGIRGVVYFMAPEVVCGHSLPDVQSDEYSLAVILFRLFFHHHPMNGVESVAIHGDEKLNRNQCDQRIYGTHPHYCLDMSNPVNHPHPQFHRDVRRLCMVFPDVLLGAFQRVFTAGVKDKSARLTSTEWRKVLLQVRDSLVHVNGTEQFFFTPQQNKVPEAARILVYPHGQRVLCMPDKLLYSYHMDEYSKDFKTPVGKIIATRQEDVIGLYNATGGSIKVTYQGKSMVCQDKERIPLFPGMTLEMGKMTVSVQ